MPGQYHFYHQEQASHIENYPNAPVNAFYDQTHMGPPDLRYQAPNTMGYPPKQPEHQPMSNSYSGLSRAFGFP